MFNLYVKLKKILGVITFRKSKNKFKTMFLKINLIFLNMSYLFLINIFIIKQII